MARIYLASSWRNAAQPALVEYLRGAGHEVYDFRHPNLGRGQENGFRWSDIDPEWQSWSPEQYREALRHPIAVEGFAADKGGMDWADTCVLLLPCGRSAHSEAAYMAGQGKRTIVVLQRGEEPELMYGLFGHLVTTYAELLELLAQPAAPSICVEGCEGPDMRCPVHSLVPIHGGGCAHDHRYDEREPLGEMPGLPPIGESDVVLGRQAAHVMARARREATAEAAVLLIQREGPSGAPGLASLELARRLDAAAREGVR